MNAAVKSLARPAMRTSELYEMIWKEDPNYGTAVADVVDTVDHRIIPHMRRVFKDGAPNKVVDFGAGDGRFLDLLKQRGAMALGVGIDVVAPDALPDWLTWHKQTMWSPVREIDRCDYAISTDALEHVEPEMVRGCLMQIRQAAPHGFLRISLREDSYGTERGLHLHPSLFSANEWLSKLSQAGIEVTSFKVYLGHRRVEQALEVWF